MLTRQPDLDNPLLKPSSQRIQDGVKLMVKTFQHDRWAGLLYCVSNVEGPAQRSVALFPGFATRTAWERWTLSCAVLPHDRPPSCRVNWRHTWTLQTLILQVKLFRYKAAQPAVFKPKNSGLILTVLLSSALRNRRRLGVRPMCPDGECKIQL